eukprot:5575117-Amphidinium_carterae.1
MSLFGDQSDLLYYVSVYFLVLCTSFTTEDSLSTLAVAVESSENALDTAASADNSKEVDAAALGDTQRSKGDKDRFGPSVPPASTQGTKDHTSS